MIDHLFDTIVVRDHKNLMILMISFDTILSPPSKMIRRIDCFQKFRKGIKLSAIDSMR